MIRTMIPEPPVACGRGLFCSRVQSLTVRRSLAATSCIALLCAGCDDAPAPGAAASPAGPPWFADVSADLGIEVDVERPPAPGDYFMPDSMTGGCALFDCDGDGDLDLYLVHGVRAPDGALESPAGANRLWRQEGDGRFVDVTVEAGVGDRGFGMGVATGDIDNDGDVDLFVANYGRDRLYRNDGDGTFTDVTDAAGILDTDTWSASAGFHDLDGDGFLDLFVTSYLAHDPAVTSTDASGRPEYAGPAPFDGVPDVLYRNRGDGSFFDATAAAGIAGSAGKGLGVVFVDLDRDGRVDIYVANDGEPNAAWIAGGDGTYEDQAHALGLAVSGYGRPEASMGIACGDGDGDGLTDLYLSHLVLETNTLYRATASGRYDDATLASGLGAASTNDTGFGTAFLDIELDGDLDIVVANGRVLRASPHPNAHPALSAHWRPYAEPDRLLLNDGTGRFSPAPALAGALTANVEVGRGLAVGDLDDDGDLDVVVANGSGTLRVYRNDARRAGAWLVVRAIDPSLRRDAIGATVEVTAGRGVFRRDVRAAGSYLAASDPRVHFGLGAVTRYDEMAVTWPDGTRETFPGGPANRLVVVRRGETGAAR